MSITQNSFKIQNRNIGDDFPPLVIAEIGINHEGNFDKAIQMIDDSLYVNYSVKYKKYFFSF